MLRDGAYEAAKVLRFRRLLFFSGGFSFICNLVTNGSFELSSYSMIHVLKRHGGTLLAQ